MAPPSSAEDDPQQQTTGTPPTKEAATRPDSPLLVRNIAGEISPRQFSALLQGISVFDTPPGTFEALIDLNAFRWAVTMARSDLDLAFDSRPTDDDEVVLWEARYIIVNLRRISLF